MSIESHIVTQVEIQKGGKKKLRISFVDHNGQKHPRVFRNRPSDIDIEKYALQQYSIIESNFKKGEVGAAIDKLCCGIDSLEIVSSADHSDQEDILLVLIKTMMASDDFKTIESMQSAMEYFRANYVYDDQKRILGVDNTMMSKINEKYNKFMIVKDSARIALNIIEEI